MQIFMEPLDHLRRGKTIVIRFQIFHVLLGGHVRTETADNIVPESRGAPRAGDGFAVLETCEGTGYERRGLNMLSWKGILDFWRRMTSRLQNSTKPKPKLAAATDEVRQQKNLHDT